MLSLLITVTHKATINYAKVKMTSSDRRPSMSRWTVVHNSLEQVILKVTHSDRPSACSLAHNQTSYRKTKRQREIWAHLDQDRRLRSDS